MTIRSFRPAGRARKSHGLRRSSMPKASQVSRYRARVRSMARVKNGCRTTRLAGRRRPLRGTIRLGPLLPHPRRAHRPPGPPAAGPRRGRPRLIGIQNSKHVRIADLNLHNQAVWCLFILYSEDVTAEGLHITAEHNIPSSDGIDIDSSKHVVVNNVYIDVNDDCISIKSGKDADGLRVNRPAEDILIENSHFQYATGAVAMGGEPSGEIRKVRCATRSPTLATGRRFDLRRSPAAEEWLKISPIATSSCTALSRPSSSIWSGAWCRPSLRRQRSFQLCAT